jgi:hypothetical protein
VAAAGPAAAGPRAAGPTAASPTAANHVRFYKPNAVNNLDCNGWSKKYKALNPGHRMLCTDPIETYSKYYKWHGRLHSKRVTGRFVDNGHYVGHDEPSTKFISSAAGTFISAVVPNPEFSGKCPVFNQP